MPTPESFAYEERDGVGIITLDRPDCTGINRPPRPSAPVVELAQGETVAIVVDPGDPDADQVHTIELIDGPLRGWTDGRTFTADLFQIGGDSVVLRVTDDGEPALSATVEVPIRVYPAGFLEHDAPEAPRSGGCATVRPLRRSTSGRPRHPHPADRPGRSHTDPGPPALRLPTRR